MKQRLFSWGAGLLTALAPVLAVAQEAAAVPVPDKGDTTWMLISTILVLLMILPGLALFYGGLVRSRNMLSVLMQVLTISALVMVLWILYGYSFAFGGLAHPFFGGTAKLFLAGVTADSTSATFSDGVVIPEYVFICFQMTFACITAALIVGAFAERIKFSALLLFTALWVTFAYLPIAHMVWDASGYIFGLGALDFAGGTVVHINAGVAGLVGCLMVGKRLGYPREPMPPHSMVMTLIGASLLWVGWFGFNAGSNLEANAAVGLPFINTFAATAAAMLAWTAAEWLARGKPSLLGGASGVVAGLVAITPAAGSAGPVGALVLGAVASLACYGFVTLVKPKFGFDDTADVFGIHGVAGILGSILTGVVHAPSLGGAGDPAEFDMASQVLTQCYAVGISIVWCAVVSVVLFFLVDKLLGLRVSTQTEREGLDIAEHGERAYHH